MTTEDDEEDLAIIEAIRARGPVWIPAAEAFAMMDQMEAEVDRQEAEDTAAAAEWDALKASGQAVTVTHEEARQRLGFD